MSYDPELFADDIETYLIHASDGKPLPYVPQAWFESSPFPFGRAARVRAFHNAKLAHGLLTYAQAAAVGGAEWPAALATTGRDGTLVYAARPVARTSKAWRKHGEGHQCVIELGLAAPNADILADHAAWHKSTGMQQTNIYAWRRGDEWECTSETLSHHGDVARDTIRMIGVLGSAGVMAAATWRARFSLGGAHIDVPTTLAGARALFADRLATGPRRSALRHWVRAHSRTVGEVTSDVVAHLRGASKFEWHGMTAELVPSAADAHGGADMGAAALAARCVEGLDM